MVTTGGNGYSCVTRIAPFCVPNLSTDSSEQFTYFANTLYCAYAVRHSTFIINVIGFLFRYSVFKSKRTEDMWQRRVGDSSAPNVDSPSDRHSSVRHANVADGNPSRSKGSSTRSCDHDCIWSRVDTNYIPDRKRRLAIAFTRDRLSPRNFFSFATR